MPRMDPNTSPIGCQPAVVHIRPSKSYPWYGRIVGSEIVDLAPAMLVTVARGGARWTEQQAVELARLELDPDDVRALTVQRQAADDEVCVGTLTLPPLFAFDCPVVGTWRDKLKVIAPSGETKSVFPNGWAHRPRLYPRDLWGRAA